MTAKLPPPAALRWWTLAVVSVSTFMLMLDLSVVSVALPGIHDDLDASFSGMQWVFDAYALTLAAFLVTSGSVADRSGRKRLFLTGLSIFTLASLACGVAGNIGVLNVSRGVQGVGAAIMFAVGPALLGHEFHGKERAAAFSAFGGAIGLAVATGPLIGGALTNGPGWRWIFLVNVPVGVLTFLLAIRKLRESRLASAAAPDFIGMITFTLSLAALALAIIRGNTDGWFSATNIALYVTSAVCLGIFLAVARSLGERAMFDLNMFRGRTFIGLSAVAFLCNTAGFPSVFIETNYLQGVLHSTAWQAGLRFLPLTLAMFVFGAVTGGLIGKVPFRFILGAAGLLLGTGLLLTRLSGADDSWTALIPGMAVTGAAFGIVNPARAAMAIGVVEPAKAGVASGISESFQQMGMALGIAIGGAYFENRTIHAFLHSGAAAQLGSHGHAVASAVSAGGIDAAAKAAGPALSTQVATDGRAAFTIGFHDAMTLCAVIAFVAAVVALSTLSNKDLHESAMTGIPPEVPEESELQPVETTAAVQH